MGVCIELDIFKDRMRALMDDLEFVRVYIDDFLVITLESSEEHLSKSKEVIKRLQSDRLKLNIDKYKWEAPKVEYLGYIIMQEGIKPDPKKVEAIINIERPMD